MLGQAVGDRLPLGVRDPQVLIEGPENSGEKLRGRYWLDCEGMMTYS